MPCRAVRIMIIILEISSASTAVSGTTYSSQELFMYVSIIIKCISIISGGGGGSESLFSNVNRENHFTVKPVN